MKTTTDLGIAILALTKGWSITPTQGGIYILTPPARPEEITEHEINYWESMQSEFTNQALN